MLLERGICTMVLCKNKIKAIVKMETDKLYFLTIINSLKRQQTL